MFFCPDLSELTIFMQDSRETESGGETNLFRIFFEFIFFAPDLCEPVSAPDFRPIYFLCSGICPLHLFLLRRIFPGFDSIIFFLLRSWQVFYSGFPSNLFSLVRNACECKVRSCLNIFRVLFDFFPPQTGLCGFQLSWSGSCTYPTMAADSNLIRILSDFIFFAPDSSDS